MKTILIILVIIFTINTVNWYEYKWKEYKIYVPENIEYLEYCYISTQCSVWEYEAKLIYINIYLIKLWLNPIY